MKPRKYYGEPCMVRRKAKLDTTMAVVLCGGHATRLNHKLFLCLRSGRPAFTSGVESAHRDRVSRILMLQDSKMSIETALKKFQKNKGWSMNFTKDHRIPTMHATDNHAGVVAAILGGLTVAVKKKHKYVSFYCGDNVYDSRHRVCYSRTFNTEIPHAVVRKVDTEWSDQLDCCKIDGETGEWISRDENLEWKLTSPWVFPVSSIRDIAKFVLDNPEGSLLELFNFLGVRPVENDRKGWFDLGTPEAVKEYYS